MRIGIAGPISSESIAPFIDDSASDLPRGYPGAPLLGTLIGALLARGHRIDAYTTSTDLPLTARHVATGKRFKITFCPQRSRAFRFADGHWGRAMDAFRLEREALTRAMRHDRPDIIHAHWTYEFALAALDSGLPHLITCHDAPQVVLRYMPNLYRLVRYFMAKRVLARARHLTAVSPYLRDKVARYAQVPISLVPNPIPSALANKVTALCEFDPTHPRIAMVLNGWGKLKNPQPALRAFARLRQQVPGAELIIMGKDFGAGERAERWSRAQRFAAGVRFLGDVPYPLLLAELAKTDLLLHPSLEEAFGMSIAEAMALGVPVLGGERNGAVPWVIGAGGMTTDVTSEKAIAESMQHILSNAEDHARYCIQAGQQAKARFSSAYVAQAYEADYQAAITGARP